MLTLHHLASPINFVFFIKIKLDNYLINIIVHNNNWCSQKNLSSHRGQNDASIKTQLAYLVAQIVKNLPAMQETWDLSLGWEDPLEKGMATHSSILVWRIPWTEEPGRLQSIGW